MKKLPEACPRTKTERRKAAGPDLLDAGKAVVNAWESGDLDLASAVRTLADAINRAEEKPKKGKA